MPSFSCPACGAAVNVPDERVGHRVRCPRCQTPFTADPGGGTTPGPGQVVVASPPPLTALRASQSVTDEVALLEARTTAKEVASKYIGKHAVPWIVMLVVTGVAASYFLSPASLTAVIGR